MPKSDKVNNDAITYFKRIINVKDSNYAELRMKAFYRLGCYYIAFGDKKNAILHFTGAKEEAERLGNTEYMENSEKQIIYCKDNL